MIPPLALARLRQLHAAAVAAQQACQDQAGIVAMTLGIDPRARRIQVQIDAGVIIDQGPMEVDPNGGATDGGE